MCTYARAEIETCKILFRCVSARGIHWEENKQNVQAKENIVCET